MQLAYCENSLCCKELHVDDNFAGPYLCEKCAKNRAEHQKLMGRWDSENIEYDEEVDYKKDHKMTFVDYKKPFTNRLLPPHVETTRPLVQQWLSIKRMWDDEMKKFDRNHIGRLHHKYGKVIFSREVMGTDGDLTLREIDTHVKNQGGTHLKIPDVLNRIGERWVTKQIIEILMGVSAKQGVEAWEAIQEDEYFKRSGGTSVYLSCLQRDTPSLLCHSDDELPF